MADIFISYSSSDREKAKALAEAIQQQGWSVWWDRKIPYGKSFDQVIEQELDAARCVVVVWTKTSAASDWVKTEAAEGARRHVLLPVFLDDVKIPLEFRRLQAANLTDWQPGLPNSQFDQLLMYVGEMLGKPTLPGEPEVNRPQPARNSADPGLESFQKTAHEETNPPASAPAERGKSEFERGASETLRQHEGHYATDSLKRAGLPISRTRLLILGGVTAPLMLVLIIAVRPSGHTPDDPQGEPLAAPAVERPSEPEIASTVPAKGTTRRLLDQVSEITMPKTNQGRGLVELLAGGTEAETLFAKGEQYYHGNGVPQNYAEAAKWYHKAADRDHPGAQKKLAQMYRDGVGVGKNEHESLKWEMKVLEQQQKESSKTLDEMNKKALDAIGRIKAG